MTASAPSKVALALDRMGLQVLMAQAAAEPAAAPAARHRHVRRGQVDRPRCARGHGLGCRRQPARRPARRTSSTAAANAGPLPSRSAWTSAAAASIPTTLPELIRVDRRASQPEILYLDCAGAELIRRYDETRRRHPLAPDRPAEDGIARERELTAPLRSAADSVLDTTDLKPAELRDELRRRYGGDPDQPVLTIASFGFARGISRTADLVFDMRFLPNPHWVDELRPLTGEDAAGAGLSAAAIRPGARRMDRIEALLIDWIPRYWAAGKSYVTVAFGCTGGRHRRSPRQSKWRNGCASAGFAPNVRHRDLASPPSDTIERHPARAAESEDELSRMIGLVLVTHGRLAAEFVTAMEHVVGPQEAIEAICIGPDDDMEARRKDIAEAIGKVDQGQGVIILTDLFGGTPSNLAISLMKSENIEVIAGVNLPMLIRLEGARKVMRCTPRSPRRARPAANISRSLRRSSGKPPLERGQPRGPRSPTSAGSTPGPAPSSSTSPASSTPTIEVEKDGNKVCGTSIMGLMMLGAAMGDSIIIHVDGADAEERAREAGGAGRGALRRRIMPRAGHRLFQSDRQAAALAARQEGAAGRRPVPRRGAADPDRGARQRAAARDRRFLAPRARSIRSPPRSSPRPKRRAATRSRPRRTSSPR